MGVATGAKQYEICTEAEKCEAGNGGLGAGQFTTLARNIAVDQATGAVYVADFNHISVFSAVGAVAGQLGWGVKDGSDELQFCTAQSGCQGGNFTPGTEAGKFESEFGEIEIGGLAVDAAGNLYVADPGNRRIDVFKPTLVENSITGEEVMTGMTFVRAFGWGVATGASEFEICTVAASCLRGAEGSEEGQFGFASPTSIAIDSEGNIFALDAANGRVEEFNSTPEPVAKEFGAAALTEVFGAGPLKSIAVDSTDTPNHILVSAQRNGGPAAVAELDHTGANALGAGEVQGADLAVESTNGLAVAPASLGGNIYLTTYTENTLFGVYVLNEAPTIEPVTIHAATTATFEGEVLSGGLDVKYHFETSTDGGETWSALPSEEVSAQAGRIAVEQEAEHLAGSQHYQVRLVEERNTGGRAASSAVEFDTDPAAPEIRDTRATAVTQAGANLHARLNPENEATEYRFQYVDDADFQASGYANAKSIPLEDAELPAGNAFVSLSRVLSGLAPATTYHFRLLATNGSGTTEGEASEDRAFTTLAAPVAGLPDGRGYELVSPANSGGLVPSGTLNVLSALPSDGVFNYPLASPNGESVIFYIGSGALPGLGASGTGDRYEAIRGEDGWSTRYIGPKATEAEYPSPQGVAADHGYTFFGVGTLAERGSLKTGCSKCTYLRYPDGTIKPLGEGSLGTNKEAVGNYITPDGSHVIFTSRGHLEPEAPTSVFTSAVYDRTSDGVTHVISLPNNATPTANSSYKGSSADGSAVAFETGGTLYLRRNDIETVTIGAGGRFAGLSADGERLFYLTGDSENKGVMRGELHTCEVSGGSCTPIAIGSGGESAVVNVSTDGSHVYFLSPQVLDATINENGEEAEAGAENLYAWNAANPGSARFVAQVTAGDVVNVISASSARLSGLGLWTGAIHGNGVLSTGGLGFGVGEDPSRTTPDGDTLLFQSRARLTPYENDGHIEVYRYDAASGEISCPSCNPTNVEASADATLEDPTGIQTEAPLSPRAEIANITEDGQKVFFESGEALVAGDNNGKGDVYEWEAEGQGGCAAAKGCLRLISSGHSSGRSYLYAMTPNGHDVFIRTADNLVPQDKNQGVPAIYDAREGGGFPVAAPAAGCEGEACQGPSTPPNDPTPASSSFEGAGNVREAPKARCGNGQRKARGSKAHCAKKQSKKHHKHQHRKAHRNRRPAR